MTGPPAPTRGCCRLRPVVVAAAAVAARRLQRPWSATVGWAATPADGLGEKDASEKNGGPKRNAREFARAKATLRLPTGGGGGAPGTSRWELDAARGAADDAGW